MINLYLDDVVRALKSVDLCRVSLLVDSLSSAYKDARSVFVIGNGGSAANASHFAQDLSKGAIPDLEGKRFRVLSLVDNISFITAISNDIGFERVFDLQLRQFARPDDLLVAVSASGQSPNIIRASEYAKSSGLQVVAFTGFEGGCLGELADIHINVHVAQVCVAEAVHSVLMHMVADLLKERLGDEKACRA